MFNNDPFYDPCRTYEENYQYGPFGIFVHAFTYKPRLKKNFTFLGHSVNAPFGIPAGPLINGAFVKAALDHGFPICVYKTVRSQAHPCHQFPNIVAIKPSTLSLKEAATGVVTKGNFASPLSITNSFGVPSKDPAVWQKDLAAITATVKPGQLVIGSFQGTPQGSDEAALIADCVKTARLVKDTGVSVLEQNLSCPNEGSSQLLCFDIGRVEKIIKAVKAEIGSIPLIVKIAYFSDQDQLQRFVQCIGPLVEGIAAINTIPAVIINEQGDQALPGKGRAVSGVCGEVIRPYGLEMVGRLKELRKKYGLKFEIIGVGGVMTPEHFHHYLETGADSVMSATGAMWDPLLGQKITTSLLA